jgi:hypothetical protein
MEFGAMIALCNREGSNTNPWRKKIMKSAKPAKKGKTLGTKKLEKKVPLNVPVNVHHA